MDNITCPYCNEEVEINHDDGYGYEEGVLFNQECGHCDNTFTYTTGIIFVYKAYKAPCLNGGPHSWKDNQGYPKGYQSNRHTCEWCDEEELKDDSLKYDCKTDTWIPEEKK